MPDIPMNRWPLFEFMAIVSELVWANDFQTEVKRTYEVEEFNVRALTLDAAKKHIGLLASFRGVTIENLYLMKGTSDAS